MAIDGKVVVITGGAMGIGRHIAKTFAQAGARVAVADMAPMYGVADDVRRAGPEMLTVKTDVRNEEQVKSMVEEVVQRFGRIDVLVNNAAIVTHFQWGNPRWPLIKNQAKSFWDDVIGTNLGGTFLCCKHVIPHMERQGGGHIINFGQSGRGDSIGACAYGVSKAAIQKFSQYLAHEEREHNIVVLSMSPGAAIVGEYGPEEARRRMPGPEIVGNCFVEAAELGMEHSGKQVTVREGKLRIQDLGRRE
ncbi:MAG TPA: SDR family oxidoreductase [Candidatus Acidoferrales bacterium]|nr:SDR family oxidoreductase [Candidatus Acidoferrales bacterium]